MSTTKPKSTKKSSNGLIIFRRILLILSALVLLSAAILYIFRAPLFEFMSAIVTEDMLVEVDLDNFDAGPEVGSILPSIQADLNGYEVTNLMELAGENGLVLVLSRSVDWCPFCRRHAIELNQEIAQFEQAKLALVNLVNDEPVLRDNFDYEFQINYPILADVEARSVIALNALNKTYQPGDQHYGIPHPGVIVVDPEGVVVAKFFIESYSQRLSPSAIVRFSRDALSATN